MAICNLFNQQLSSPTGNFLMFSQYVEDITRNYTEGDNWKVIPTKFVALDVDYSKVHKSMVTPNADELTGDSLNTGIPRYFQNCFENACAYGKNNKTDWTAETSKNLFWNFMFDGGLLTETTYTLDNDNRKYVPEVVYYGDINMHSYNEHQGMGYGEIYCYIPTDAARIICQVDSSEDRNYDTNSSVFLEGFDGDVTKTIENYIQRYDYNQSFSMSFDDDTLPSLRPGTETKYKINTIVVLYSIFNKLNGTWLPVYSNIPMGMYIAGIFDDDCTLSNTIIKHVSTSYGTGTSYGLRICTRFSATSNGQILNTDITSDDNGYSNMCQLMTAMNENLSRMMEISKSAINTTLSYKETLAAIKNNRTNVPYVKNVNGVDCWFVNGRFVTSVKGDNLCVELSDEAIDQRLNNLMDEDTNNDWTPITDPNDDSCTEEPISNIVNYIRTNFDPDFEFNDENGNPIPDIECDCPELEFATDEEVVGGLVCDDEE